jgi:hypothetical protein
MNFCGSLTGELSTSLFQNSKRTMTSTAATGVFVLNIHRRVKDSALAPGHLAYGHNAFFAGGECTRLVVPI